MHKEEIAFINSYIKFAKYRELREHYVLPPFYSLEKEQSNKTGVSFLSPTFLTTCHTTIS